MVVVVGNELVEEVQGGLEGVGKNGGEWRVEWRGGGGRGGGVPYRTEPSARNAARQYRTVPILKQP